MQDGMTEQDQDDYNKGMAGWDEAEKKQHEEDAAIMRDVKKLVTPERYTSIEREIEDSEKASNYRIIKKPVGDHYAGDNGIEG